MVLRLTLVQPLQLHRRPLRITAAAASNGGWVIELDAYHFHNGKPEYRNAGDEQDGFVLKTLIHKLEEGKVKLPVENEEGKTG
ncbi:MAG: hypothetical protein U0930_05790 [Pirellulales bacterium]